MLDDHSAFAEGAGAKTTVSQSVLALIRHPKSYPSALVSEIAPYLDPSDILARWSDTVRRKRGWRMKEGRDEGCSEVVAIVVCLG